MGKFENKKVLVTGASGFIGSHLTSLLLNEGAEITIITRYNSIERNVRLAYCWNSLKKIEADIRYIESLFPLRKERYDYIFHLAAYHHVGNSFGHFNEAIEVNAKGTVNLLESISNYGKFIYISTSEVYGFQDVIPFVENMIPRPNSPYAVGKYAGELYSLMKHRESNLPIVAVRPFNAFGPYQSTLAIMPELIVKCLLGKKVLTTEGKQTREFNYVLDLAEGLLSAALSENAVGEIINLGTGKDISIRDVALLIHKKTNSKSELKIGAMQTRPNEIWKMRSDATKARKILGWKPKIDFDEGLNITIEWFSRFIDIYYSANSSLALLNK